MAQEAAEREMVFQSTLPAWGATRAACWSADSCSISIHAPRVGSDTGGEPGGGSGDIFQSTLPAWGATSAPSPCGCSNAISIHAPRVGSDGWRVWREWIFRYFNPRSPRGERRQPRAGRRARRDFNPRSPRGERLLLTRRYLKDYKFQSTLPAWGATYGTITSSASSDFNPRSPRGERHDSLCHWRLSSEISIHAPRVGSDEYRSKCKEYAAFQSTLPAWGATDPPELVQFIKRISIHAPRVGSDT